jgi:hypothetical protein
VIRLVEVLIAHLSGEILRYDPLIRRVNHSSL